MSTTLPYLAAVAPPQAYVQEGDPSLFRRARTWWLLLALFIMTQGNGLFTRQDNTYWGIKTVKQQFEGSSVLLMLTVAMCVICVALMLTSIRQTLRMALKQKAILAFAVLGFLSTLWSQDPSLTFRRATLLFLTFAFAWFFATYYSPADQMRLLLAAGVIVALASIAMALLLPQFGISKYGEWKGVFAHKNHLGLGMFFLFSALPFCNISSGRRLLTLALQAVLPVGLILLSQSKTSLILVALLIAVRAFGPYITSRRKEQLPFALFLAICGIALTVLGITFGREIILPLLGKEPTLTGRTEHWAVLAPFALKHLWLGYGYSAFWTGTGDSLQVMNIIGAGMKGSDSGFVDMMLQFGLVGLSLMFIVFLTCARDFVRLFRRDSMPLVAYWYVGLIVATLVGSFTETLFLGSVTTFIFAIACAGLRNLRYGEEPS
jgi:O-antigen ligase